MHCCSSTRAWVTRTMEMKARIGPLGKLDCLYTKEKIFWAEKWPSPTRFYGWADTEPSNPVTSDLHAWAHAVLEGVPPGFRDRDADDQIRDQEGDVGENELPVRLGLELRLPRWHPLVRWNSETFKLTFFQNIGLSQPLFGFLFSFFLGTF